MKALVWHGPLDVRIEERPLPQPGAGEVLVRLQALGICGSDLKLYKYGILGTLQPSLPFIMGHEGAGQVVQLGSNVNGLSVGDAVVINPQFACGECVYCRKGSQNLCEHLDFKSVTTDGIFSEFALIRASQAVPLPIGFDFGLATTIEPVSVAVQALRSTNISPSDSVLVIGAGSVGLGVLGVLNCRGVRQVAVIDPQDFALERARKMGVALTLNPQKETLTGKMSEFFGKYGPELVVDASGSSAAQAMAIETARPGGAVILIGITAESSASVNVNRLVRSNLRVYGSVRTSGDAFQTAAHLVISKELDTSSWISRVFPFEQAAQAFAAVIDPSQRVTKCLITFEN